METDIYTVVTDLFSSVGMWAVFAYLYIQERKEHAKTQRHWNEDLREIAGLKAVLRKPEEPHINTTIE